MKIVIGADHAGYELKKKLIEFLKSKGYTPADFGTHSKQSCDYPPIAREVAEAVSEKRFEKGILVCTTGIGMAIAANKIPGIRAGVCWIEELARYSRRHNDVNVLVLPGKFIDFQLAKEIVSVWLQTPFSEEERHWRRIGQITEIELRKAQRDR